LDMNYAALNKALAKRDWSAATRALYPTLAPTLPYLHLPENNAIETVLEMGNYMKSAAEVAALTAETDEAKARVKEQYKAAFAVYAHIGKAAWSSLGMVGKLKSYQMLMALEKPKTARQLFENLTAPTPGDRAYGLYWLVKSQLDIDKSDYRAAMQAAIKSLCFENKDVDTFPDALLISAQCYEEFQEWHRARDVYYEVARIFPDTDWSERSVRRLRFIMAKGLTKDQEKSPIENVFFKLNEDINQKVKDLFDALAAGKKNVYQEYAEKAEGDKAKDVEEKVTLNLDEPDK
jgi:tetratricopeptide (TPR) repeat protein